MCDLCGVRRNFSDLRRTADNSFICSYHDEYRTAFEVDAENRRGRAPREVPVPFPKPADPNNPYTFIEEEGHLLAFIERMTAVSSRYLNVTSGAGSELSGEMLGTLGWAGYYLYGLVAENKRPEAMLSKAALTLDDVASALQTRQVGFGISLSATRATSSFYGAFLESGASTYVTEDTILAGVTLLYAYRVTGTQRYLLGARAAASYLRNVQAIGKFGVNHTSTDAAGTGYLYTGSLCSQVSTAAGFYSNHLFYPAALLALVFWKELTATDGDQQLGATAAIAGDFAQVPQQLMSECMADLRACWETGIRQATGETVNGLSADTPREFFNAYPAIKANFDVNGTGLWEFYAGNSSTGTNVTGANVAKSLHALYVYEGASMAVAALDDWLRGFTSNEEFETPDNTSPGVLARTTTGEYDGASAIATLLTVRDASASFVPTATNGSSLYDWGAFGLLASLRAARHNSEFAAGRRIGVYVNQRLRDGQPTDGDHYDPLPLHGRSGLSKQTYFFGSGVAPLSTPGGSSGGLGPLATTEGGIWLKADAGVTKNGSNRVTAWNDQLPLAQHLTQTVSGTEPTWVDAAINGLPAIRTGSPNDGFFALSQGIYRTSNLKKSSSSDFTSGDARTVYAVIVPEAWNHGASSGTGGGICSFKEQPGGVFGCDAYNWNNDSRFYAYRNASADLFKTSFVSPWGQTVIMKWVYDGTEVRVYMNGTEIALVSNAANPADTSANPGFYVGRSGGIGQGHTGNVLLGEFRVFPGLLTGTETATWDSYLTGRWFQPEDDASNYIVRDAVRAAQMGLSFRQQPVAQRYAGT